MYTDKKTFDFYKKKPYEIRVQYFNAAGKGTGSATSTFSKKVDAVKKFNSIKISNNAVLSKRGFKVLFSYKKHEIKKFKNGTKYYIDKKVILSKAF